MNGRSTYLDAGGWDDEPAWASEVTGEWQPHHGQRYPGDPGRAQAVLPPAPDPSAAADAAPSRDASGTGRQVPEPPRTGQPLSPGTGRPRSRPVSLVAGRATVRRPPQPPPSWAGPSDRPARPGPAWNRPVPMP